MSGCGDVVSQARHDGTNPDQIATRVAQGTRRDVWREPQSSLQFGNRSVVDAAESTQMQLSGNAENVIEVFKLPVGQSQKDIMLGQLRPRRNVLRIRLKGVFQVRPPREQLSPEAENIWMWMQSTDLNFCELVKDYVGVSCDLFPECVVTTHTQVHHYLIDGALLGSGPILQAGSPRFLRLRCGAGTISRRPSATPWPDQTRTLLPTR